MIGWIKKKFASILSIGFVLYVILFGFTGFTAGMKEGGIALVICSALGIFLGLFSGILIFGLYAVIINISDSNEAILKKLNEMAKNTSSASDTTAVETKE